MIRKDGDKKTHAGERQSELFVEFETQSSKKPGSIFRHDITFRKKIILNLSYENLVMLSIIVIMLTVVFFSLGVEKGKKVALKNSVPLTAEAYHRKPDREEQAAPMEQVNLSEKAPAEKPDAAQPAKEQKEALSVHVKPYTIQVVAFKKERNAKKEIALIKRKGREAFIIPTKDWFQVCSGRYANMEEAKGDLGALKIKYPTCYIRKIE